MTCITISRQLGSLGSNVADQVGKMLAYRVFWREVINQAALRAGAPEMALATIDDLGLLGLRPSPAARKAYRLAIEQVMHELADQGSVVIVGRAGQVILRERIDTLHVRVIAPAGLRAQRIAEQQKIPIEAARNQIEASDRNRQNFLRTNYQVRLDDPELYDLVVNTAHFTPEQSASWIVQAVQSLTTGRGV